MHDGTNYNGELAAASSRREVSNLRSDMREAKETGPQTAELTDAMTRMEALQREALLPIKSFIVDVLAGVVSMVEDAIRVFLEFVHKFDLLPDEVQAYAGRLIEALNGGGGGDLVQEWIEKAQQLRPEGVQSSPRSAPPPMNLPIFTR